MAQAAIKIDPAEADQLTRYQNDPGYHAKNCLLIRDHDTAKIVPLAYNASQKIVHTVAEMQRADMGIVRILLLKARRFGGSTQIQGRFYSKTSLNFNRNTFIVGHEKESTNTLFEMAKLMQERNPIAPSVLKNNEKALKFDNSKGTGLKSEYRLATAENVDAGRSQGIHYLHLSEEAFWRDGETLLTGLLQCVPDPPAETEIFRESTANGYGNSFQEAVFDAYSEGKDVYYSARLKDVASHIPDGNNNYSFAWQRPGQDWILVFIPWFMHDRYVRTFDTAEQRSVFEHSINEKVFEPIELQWIESEGSKLRRKYGLSLEQLHWREWAIENKCNGSVSKFRQEYPACVVGDTRVSTEKGILKIQDAKGAKHTESGPIQKWVPQPISSIFRLETEQGRLLRGTFDHPVKTTSGFIGLRDLIPGQSIELRKPILSTQNHIEKWNLIAGAVASVKINELWGEFIGFFMGDGSYYKDTISVVCDENDQDVIGRVIYIFGHLLGGCQTRVIRKVQDRKGAVVIRKENGQFRDVFWNLGLLYKNYNGRGQIKRKVYVPEIIFKSPENVVRRFLSALFECDGSVSSNKVRFASSKIEFVRDIQLLLLAFGINSSFYQHTKKAGNGNEYQSYELRLTVAASIIFHEKIGFISSRKKGLKPEETSLGRHSRNELFDKVKNIVKEESQEITYDFIIDNKEHAFSANGILTHNTVEEAFLSTGTNVYPKELCDNIEENCQEPMVVGDLMRSAGLTRIKRNKHGKFRLWEKPDLKGQYFMCIDSGGGKNERQKKEKKYPDPTCIDVWNHRTGKQAGQWHGHIEYDLIADITEMIGDMFGRKNCPACVEMMNHGYTVIADLKRKKYPMYERLPGEPGWSTNVKTKPLMVDDLYRMARDGGIHIRCKETVSEMRRFIEENGRYNAASGCHDERVDTAGMASQMFQLLPTRLAEKETKEFYGFKNIADRYKPEDEGYREYYARV